MGNACSKQYAPVPEDERKRAWKFEGYPAFSKFQASSRDVTVFRGFGALSDRCMLLMQDDIVRLEGEIAAIDLKCKRDVRLDDAVSRNDSFRFDASFRNAQGTLTPDDELHRQRDRLMAEAIIKTKQYREHDDDT